MKKAGKSLIRIVTATAVTIFSLFTGITGVYAWFKTNTSGVEIQADMFSVVNQSVSIDGIKLIKFNYPVVAGTVDYMSAENGTVDDYSYNSDPGIKAFGYYDDPVTPSGWHTVTMNRFDPVRIEIGDELIDQYCNAIYEVTISSTMDVTYLKVFANHVDKEKQEREIYLSDCLDFDVFTEDEVAALNTAHYLDFDVTGISSPYALDFYGKAGGTGSDVKYFAYSSSSEASQTDIGVNFEFVETYVDSEKTYARFTYDINPFCVSTHTFSYVQLNSSDFDISKVSAVRPDWYPSYIDESDPLQDPNLASKGTYAELFHKIAYLSSQKSSHAHFYGLSDKSEPLPIHDPNNLKVIPNTATFYLNVNYAPSQLEQYSSDLILGERIAVYDYYFSIDI